MSTIFDAIWAFSEDIVELRKRFLEELEAHTSQPIGIPLHSFRGQLILDGKGVQLLGKRKGSQANFRLNVPCEQITDVFLGWDNVLRRWRDTRAWIRPLRLTFKENQKSKTLYVYARSHGIRPYGNENKRTFEMLSSKLGSRLR